MTCREAVVSRHEPDSLNGLVHETFQTDMAAQGIPCASCLSTSGELPTPIYRQDPEVQSQQSKFRELHGCELVG